MYELNIFIQIPTLNFSLHVNARNINRAYKVTISILYFSAVINFIMDIKHI